MTTILNRQQVDDRVQIFIATGQNVKAGLVYQNGDKDWRNVPLTAQPKAKKIYVLENGFDNSSGTDVKTEIAFGEGARFIDTADGAITLNENCSASTSTVGLLSQATAIGTTTATIIAALENVVAQYKGHADELKNTVDDASAAVDGDTDCVFQIRRLL